MSSASNISFTERLLSTREKRDLSQESLAKKAGLPPSAISHFETGTRKPSFDNLRKLADALSVSVDYLMGRTEDLRGNATQGAEIFRDYNNLTEQDQELARDFLARLAKRNQ